KYFPQSRLRTRVIAAGLLCRGERQPRDLLSLQIFCKQKCLCGGRNRILCPICLCVKLRNKKLVRKLIIDRWSCGDRCRMPVWVLNARGRCLFIDREAAYHSDRLIDLSEFC